MSSGTPRCGSTPFRAASGTWTMSVRPAKMRRQVGETADVVEVVVGQEQVDLVGAGEQLARPAGAAAWPRPVPASKMKQQRAVVDGNARRLARARGNPALCAEERQSHGDAALVLVWQSRSSVICYPVPAFVGERAFMQSALMAAAQAVTLDSPYDSVFVPLVDDLVDAVAGDDPAGFLTAVEGRARLLAAERSLRLADVFAALQLGLGAFRGALAGPTPDDGARRAAARAPRRRSPAARRRRLLGGSRRGGRPPESDRRRPRRRPTRRPACINADRSRPPPGRRARALPAHRGGPGRLPRRHRGRRRRPARRAAELDEFVRCSAPAARRRPASLRRRRSPGRPRVRGGPARRQPARRAGRARASAPRPRRRVPGARPESPFALRRLTSTSSTSVPTDLMDAARRRPRRGARRRRSRRLGLGRERPPARDSPRAARWPCARSGVRSGRSCGRGRASTRKPGRLGDLVVVLRRVAVRQSARGRSARPCGCAPGLRARRTSTRCCRGRRRSRPRCRSPRGSRAGPPASCVSPGSTQPLGSAHTRAPGRPDQAQLESLAGAYDDAARRQLVSDLHVRPPRARPRSERGRSMPAPSISLAARDAVAPRGARR